MKFTLLQRRILDALSRHAGDKITEEQLAARLVIPFSTFRYELYRLRRQAKTRTTIKLVEWWNNR